MERKKHTHIGIYGLIIKNDRILLIKKANGPYKGKLDLPGGSLEFGERPEDTLIREIKEETGLDVIDYKINNSDSVTVDWNWDGKDVSTHHIGIFYDIISYKGEVERKIDVDNQNDDSLGASFYDISILKKDNLSLITIIELERLGYKL